ncbi:hypothetical protein QOT17_024864 [Balamuthia mandrillaris]
MMMMMMDSNDEYATATLHLPQDGNNTEQGEIMVASSCLEETGTVTLLPLELQSHVLSYFSPQELCLTIAPVCKLWSVLAIDDSRWKELCRVWFPYLQTFNVVKPEQLSWCEWFKLQAIAVTKGWGLCPSRSSSALRLEPATEGGRVFVVATREWENERTRPFPPPHKVACGNKPIKEGEQTYFEVLVETMFEMDKTNTTFFLSRNTEDDNEIGVGLILQGTSMKEFLGQNSNSGGYYNTGCIGFSGRFAKQHPPTRSFSRGDRIGVLVDLTSSERSMGFFVNGEWQGFLYYHLPKDKGPYYPAVSLKSAGNQLTICPFLPDPPSPPKPSAPTIINNNKSGSANVGGKRGHRSSKSS